MFCHQRRKPLLALHRQCGLDVLPQRIFLKRSLAHRWVYSDKFLANQGQDRRAKVRHIAPPFFAMDTRRGKIMSR